MNDYKILEGRTTTPPPPNFKGFSAPFGWVGGKSRLAKDIITFMPRHECYVEVFGGALSVLYRKEPSKIEIVNDINGELINLHRVIKTRPLSLAYELNNMPKSREIFYDIKVGNIEPRNNIQRAAFYFYSIALSFGKKGEHFAMAKDNSGKNIYMDFNVYSKRLKRVIIENLSFDKLISNYDRKEALFYADPPYVGTESYYKSEFGLKEHERLAGILSRIDGKFMLSYNDCKLVRELYKGYKMIELNVTYSLNARSKNRAKKELLIMNF